MILPTKGIAPDRCILGVGGDVLGLMQDRAYRRFDALGTIYEVQEAAWARCAVAFDWFILALDFLIYDRRDRA
ncbi:MAG: ABC-three component system middle component 6 [Collinsella sp.]